MKNKNSLKDFGHEEYLIVCKLAHFWANHFFHVTESNQYDLDDLTQEAFLKICKGFHTYNPELSQFSTWASKSIRNHFKDLADKEYGHRVHAESLWKSNYDDRQDEYEVVPACDSETEETADQEVLLEDIEKAFLNMLSKLELEDQKYMKMARDGYKSAEIAAICGVTSSHVSSRVCRGKKSIISNRSREEFANKYDLCA